MCWRDKEPWNTHWSGEQNRVRHRNDGHGCRESVEMRWAITHPMIRSRWVISSCGRKGDKLRHLVRQLVELCLIEKANLCTNFYIDVCRRTYNSTFVLGSGELDIILHLKNCFKLPQRVREHRLHAMLLGCCWKTRRLTASTNCPERMTHRSPSFPPAVI